MTRIETKEIRSSVLLTRDMLSADSHLVENAASYIALQIASIPHYGVDYEGTLVRIIDAIDGNQNEWSSVTPIIVHLRDLLDDNKGIVFAAILAGLMASIKDREDLEKVPTFGFKEIREKALKLKTLNEDGITTLADEITRLTSRNN